MSFTRVGWLSTGYAPARVDTYFARVQHALEGQAPGETLTPDEVRSTRFPLSRNGYDHRQVDAALDRLELEALERERSTHAGEQWEDEPESIGDLVALSRRPRGQRFARGHRWQRHCYAVGEVDSFCDRLQPTLDGGRGPGMRAVRQVEFNAQLGGYLERDVDQFLDRVVDVLLRRMVRR